METDVIARQNKLKDLKARLRDVQGSIKRYAESLKGVQEGHQNWSATEQKRLEEHYTSAINKHEAVLAGLETQIAPLEAQRLPIDGLPFRAILSYFHGNNLEASRDALELVGMSMNQDFWIPGASRRVRSALNPAKLSKKVDTTKGEVALAELEALYFSRWDATRPAPTFTSIGASRTISATLEALDAHMVEVCPMERFTVQVTDPKTGKKSYKTLVRLLWPVGTVFGSSKYKGTKDNAQCEACGHAIKNAFNWVPLVLSNTTGIPKALWVGRDCAETLFGIKMTGELEVQL